MESELLKARIYDIADTAYKSDSFKFLGFLRVEEKVFAQTLLSKRNIKFSFFGGYPEAERVLLCVLPDWADDIPFPITPITFTYRKSDVLTHRDFLGAILSLGLKRETVGDILITDGYAVAFVLEEIADYIVSQIDKVGKVGVELKIGYNAPLPTLQKLEEFSATVSSERLDCVVSALCGLSRSQALLKIESGLVTVNSQTCLKSTKQVVAGEAISIRGKGKFVISSLADKTRKNRIVLKYKKYV